MRAAVVVDGIPWPRIRVGGGGGHAVRATPVAAASGVVEPVVALV